ncbi:glycogen debranching protein GlgX [Ramlibacter sp. 2FC]|uniref:glycogen debranching protein GlgX n=1 Tax=Ramlibacter sp. 2FC TaxID=2502188 RepID=UPI0010F82D8A|nr:glycogen debranching protein GlgX [Ramlibacter sp. 2FC]
MLPHKPAPARLGATPLDGGVAFALAAPHASAVELCLFDEAGQSPRGRHAMQRDPGGIWHGQLPGVPLGSCYGWRVHGPWAPAQGLRFNPHKLLLDPCAREVAGRYDGSDLHLGHVPGEPQLQDSRDNAASALKARVVADLPPLRQPRPQVDPARRVLYELHLKSYTMRHPGVPEALRGRYEGLAQPAVLEHLRALGITTVSLMPLAHRADEARLLAMGLSNHWGYNPIAWAAPDTRYARDPRQVREECRAMVEALHEAGLEVVLDVVFNHSAESDAGGPTLSLRGIDNRLYYACLRRDPSRYHDWAGCGNALDLNQPLALRLVMDSLRRWVEDFGIDGFRFDLAPALGRDATPEHRFQARAPLFMALAQDPVLRDRLLIAEPWDVGPGGYQLGHFPAGWLEWNDLFRDTQRAVWLHGHGTPGRWAQALAGSSAVFGGRPAHSSVNFVAAHDGFCLQDLVSYQHKHNQANGEDNRDGHAHNLSHNHGVEGPSKDPAVHARRRASQRALLASTLLALGTPMLLAGDELGHSQGGNNNAYCQDNELSWLDWEGADLALARFVAELLALRRELPLLQASGWWRAPDEEAPPGAALAHWLSPDGQPLNARDWQREHPLPIAVWLVPARRGEAACLWLLNPGSEAVSFSLPPGRWTLRLDSHAGSLAPRPLGSGLRVPARAVCLATSRSPSTD